MLQTNKVIMSNRIKDLTGMQFGRLTVLEFVGTQDDRYHWSLWRCICDPKLGGCGNIKIVKGRCLISNDTRSCGCLKGGPVKNEVGNIYGSLRVIRRIEKGYPPQHAYW
jgi:hypothetical protein